MRSLGYTKKKNKTEGWKREFWTTPNLAHAGPDSEPRYARLRASQGRLGVVRLSPRFSLFHPTSTNTEGEPRPPPGLGHPDWLSPLRAVTSLRAQPTPITRRRWATNDWLTPLRGSPPLNAPATSAPIRRRVSISTPKNENSLGAPQPRTGDSQILWGPSRERGILNSRDPEN